MARATLTPQVLPGPFEANPYMVVTWAAADVANGNQFRLTGEQILLVRNDDVGAQTVTVTSAALNGRTKDVTALSLAAAATVAFSKFNSPGWQQSDGMLYFSGAHANIKFAIIDLASNRSFG